jgi:urease beta subunit
MGRAVTGPVGAAWSSETEPGTIRGPDRLIVLAAGQSRRRITVTSRSARPVRVSSHYPFWLVNPRLEFDRAAAAGYRLDVPAGASVRWAPGESKDVDLVALGGLAGAGEIAG